VEGFTFTKPADEVAKWEPYLRDEEGCDIVIALTHMPAAKAAGEFTCSDLAETEAGAKLDGIFGGHAHSHQNLEVNGVKIMSAGWNGRGLAKMSFEYDKTAKAIVEITTTLYLQNDMNGDTILPNDPLVVNVEVKALIAEFAEAAGPLFRKWVGFFGKPILSREDQAVWATNAMWEYIVNETDEQYILLQNAGGIRDTSPYDRKATDAVTLGYLYTVLPFDNEIVLMDMKGSDLLADLLNVPDADLGSAKVVAGAYQKDGKWFMTGSDKEILDDDTIYKVAGNDFMFVVNATGLGGDSFNFTNGINPFYMGVPLRDAVIEVLLARAGFDEPQDPPYDLIPDEWYIPAIEFVTEKGLMDPASDLFWEPGTNVNRAIAFEALYRMSGSPAVEGDNFPDVSESDPFYKAALWAKATEVSEGEFGMFNGARNITRTELAAIFVRYLSKHTIDLQPTADLSGFADVGKIPQWAVEEGVFEKIVGTGIIKGYFPTELAPVAPATRAELAQMLMRLDEFYKLAYGKGEDDAA